MGIIRLLLALGVAAAHTGGGLFFVYKGSPVSAVGEGMVCAFFAMSGFYMTLAFTEHYSHIKNGATKFYQSRLLRLMPAYLIVLALSIIIALISKSIAFGPWGVSLNEFTRLFGLLSTENKILVVIANLTGLFADVFVRFGFTDGAVLASSADSIRAGTYSLILIPPAWTLAIELIFYMFLPFLLRWGKNNWIVLILFCALVKMTEYFDMVYLHYFAENVEYFISGCFAYYVYDFIKNKDNLKYLGHLSLVIFILYFSLSNYITVLDKMVNSQIIYYITLAGLPFLFAAYGNNKYDKFIGMFSYPIYISHFFVFETLLFLFGHEAAQKYKYPILLIFSLFLVLMVEMPIARYKSRKKKLVNVLNPSTEFGMNLGSQVTLGGPS